MPPRGLKATRSIPVPGELTDLGQFDAARGIKVTKVGVLRVVDGGKGDHGDRTNPIRDERGI
jgi:hypothetical protein